MLALFFQIVVIYFTSLSHAADQVIPFTFIDGMFGGGSITIPCRPGSIDALCKLDTGMNVSYFKSDAFDVLPESIGKATFTTITGSTMACDVIRLDQAQIGSGVALQPMEPVVCPASNDKTDNNLLGLDAFEGRSFSLDFAQAQLQLLEVHPSLPNQFERGSSDHIFLKVQSALKQPVEVLAMFDTGAAVSAVDIKLVEAQPDNFPIISRTPAGTDAHGNPIESIMVLGGYIKIGEGKSVAEYMIAMDFTQIQKFSGKNVQMILGYNIIKEMKWTINMRDSTWSAR